MTINRSDQTHGIMRFTTRKLEQDIELGKQWKVEIMFGIRPRSTYDTDGQKLAGTVRAHARVYRLRGMEQAVRGIEDVKRVLELGGRGFVIYDEGLQRIN